MSHTQFLLRFDDICPTMNCEVWAEIEAVLVERGIKPILAVVPDNRDPVLQVDSPAADFWDRARLWQDRGWTIAMHGYQHLYVSRNAGLAATRKKSEFAGLPARTQRAKLRRGMKIFAREGITSRVWIAPGNTFDATTVTLLPQFGIDVISAGYFQFPYISSVTPAAGPENDRLRRALRAAPSNCQPARAWRDAPCQRFSGRENEGYGNGPSGEERFLESPLFVSGLLAGHEPTPGPPEEGRLGCDGSPPERSAGVGFTERRWITWVPQQMHYFRPAPPGVWTVCYHPNNWSAAQMRKFRDDVDHYHAHIASLEEVLDRNGTRESGWSAWLCTHPRLAEFLIRAELKLWAVTRRGEV